MPMCAKCGLVAASVEMRRAPKSGALCKDRPACKIRRADLKLLQDIQQAS